MIRKNSFSCTTISNRTRTRHISSHSRQLVKALMQLWFRAIYEHKPTVFRAIMKQVRPPAATEDSNDSNHLLIHSMRSTSAELTSCNALLNSAVMCYHYEQAMHPNAYKEWRTAANRLHSPPTLDDCIKFFEARDSTMFVEDTRSTPQKSSFSAPAQSSYKPKIERTNTCVLCSGSHYILNCEDFKILSPKKRLEKIKEKHICHNCLSNKHATPECQNKGRCKTCSEKHHTWLHIEKRPQRQGTVPPPVANPVMPVVSAKPAQQRGPVFPTAMAMVSGAATSRKAHILFDSG